MKSHQAEKLLENYPSATLLEDSADVWKKTGRQMWLLIGGMALLIIAFVSVNQFLWGSGHQEAKSITFLSIMFLCSVLYSLLRKPLKDVQVLGPEKQYYKLTSRQDIQNWASQQALMQLNGWLVFAIIFAVTSSSGFPCLLWVFTGMVLSRSTQKSILAAAPQEEPDEGTKQQD